MKHTTDINLAHYTHSYISLNKRTVCIEHPSKKSKNITVRQIAVIHKQERGIDTIDYVIQLTNATSASGNFWIGDSSSCALHFFSLNHHLLRFIAVYRSCVVFAEKVSFLLPIYTIIDSAITLRKLTKSQIKKHLKAFFTKQEIIEIS